MLSADREDMLTELVNIGVGRAAYTLSEMVDSHVGLHVPRVSVDGRGASAIAAGAAGLSASVVRQGFSGGLSGTASLAISLRSARSLVAALTRTNSEEMSVDAEELDAEREAVLTEVGNIVINSILGSLGNMAALDLTFGLPRYEEGVPSAYRLAEDTAVVAVSVLFQIQTHSIAGELAVVFDASSLDGVCDALLDDSPGAEDRASP